MIVVYNSLFGLQAFDDVVTEFVRFDFAGGVKVKFGLAKSGVKLGDDATESGILHVNFAAQVSNLCK
jgi:hypothetical protein